MGINEGLKREEQLQFYDHFLFYFIEIIDDNSEKTYRLSMSSRISFAFVSPCSRMRYLLTQVTRWSLKVSFIT